MARDESGELIVASAKEVTTDDSERVSGKKASSEADELTQALDPIDEDAESVTEPGKVIRIGSMLKQLLDEVRQAGLDEPSRVRMKEIYELSVAELSTGMSSGLAEELSRMSFPFTTEAPSEAELRVAQAQLVGWLEGLFHGIQATLFAQQMTARSQLEQMNSRGLPSGRNPDATGSSGPYL